MPNETNNTPSTLQRAVDRLIGHAWTLAPTLRHSLRPQDQAPEGQTWTTDIIDELRGTIQLSGHFHPLEGALTVELRYKTRPHPTSTTSTHGIVIRYLE